MTNNSTVSKLVEMRLTTMAQELNRQLKDSSLDALSFEERLGLLVDIEYTSRKNNRLKRLIKKAGFDQPQACIADVNYASIRKLDQSQILRLASCDYIREKHNIVLMGASGAGKSYLASAFGVEACKQFFTVKYVRLPDLLADLAVSRGDGTYKKLMTQFKKPDLVILDEWMLVSLTEPEARDVLEIVHARHKRGSTIFCSQFSPAGWYSKIGEATLADAILDRIVHDSYVIEIYGGDENGKEDVSMRAVYGIKTQR